MSILRFILYLLSPILSILAIPFLIAAYIILFMIVGLTHTWYRSTNNPKYNQYWDVV